MPSPKPKSATFDTVVAASGNNTGIVVPVEVLEQLAAGKRPPVLVNVNGYEYRNTGHFAVSVADEPETSLVVVASPCSCSRTEIARAPSLAVRSMLATSALIRNEVTAGSS
jgi:hypothetical protein